MKKLKFEVISNLMTLNYKFEPLNPKMSNDEIVEIEKQISNATHFLENNLNRLLEYLKNEEQKNNYIEIDMPLLESNLSFKFNLYFGKLMVSVMNYDDSKILGQLTIDGFDCLDINEIKSLGDWHTHRKKIKRFTF